MPTFSDPDHNAGVEAGRKASMAFDDAHRAANPALLQGSRPHCGAQSPLLSKGERVALFLFVWLPLITVGAFVGMFIMGRLFVTRQRGGVAP
jgi:hypothetical protein